MAWRFIAFFSAVVFLSIGWLGSCVMYRAAEVGETVMPLEARSFETLTLITIGSGGKYENPERGGPAIVIAWNANAVLIDAGRGVAEGLRRVKIPVSQPHTVYLTNLLPENVLGLDDLLFTGWVIDRETPLRVVGPAGTRAFVDGIVAAYAASTDAQQTALGLPPAGVAVEVEEVGGGFSETLDGAEISAAALPGGPLAALAWRIDRGGRAAVVSGTGWGRDALVRHAAGADVLVHESVYIPPTEDLEAAGVVADPRRLELESALHTSILDVGALAQDANVGTLVLVRMRPPPFFAIQVTSVVNDTFSGAIILAEDGDELAL